MYRNFLNKDYQILDALVSLKEFDPFELRHLDTQYTREIGGLLGTLVIKALMHLRHLRALDLAWSHFLTIADIQF